MNENKSGEIRVAFEPDRSRTAAYDGKDLIGICQYEIKDNDWLITHTEVIPAYGGRGIARKLVLLADYKAKELNKNVIPYCSYAVKVLGGD